MGVALAIALGIHFLALRIRAGGLPGGDEGSWISAAAELSRGRGFTTRWLEAHFLTPYVIPRPDDFRYPFFTSLLALAFKVFGLSVETARWTAAAAFTGFALMVWRACRSAFGPWTAMAALWLTVTSLLQLAWNSVVYTEGLFGLLVAALALWCLRGEASREAARPFAFRSYGWWAVLGTLVGGLYLARLNGILFLPGILWLYWLRRKDGLSWRHPSVAFAAFAMAAAPWLMRTALAFGNPLHFAGSGGLLRDPGISHTLNLSQYLSLHGRFFLVERFAIGFLNFFRDLHHFEHGLEIAPLLLVCVAVIMRRRFWSPFLAMGFLFTFAACCYASYNSWAVRYMTGLMPLVYAYGLSVLPSLVQALPAAFTPAARKALPVAGALAVPLLLLPVLNPHRHYERKFSASIAAAGAYPVRRDAADHIARLGRLLPEGGRYYATSLCNLNFLTEASGCVGLQELYDPTWFARSQAAFHPGLIALTHAETGAPAMRAALDHMRASGYVQDTLETGPLAVYLSLHPAGAGSAPAADGKMESP